MTDENAKPFRTLQLLVIQMGEELSKLRDRIDAVEIVAMQATIDVARLSPDPVAYLKRYAAAARDAVGYNDPVLEDILERILQASVDPPT